MPEPVSAAIARARSAERRRVRLGLLAINPLVQRDRSMPTVMASPPTVTVGSANGSTAITASTLIPWTDARLRYLGGTPVVAGVSSPDNAMGVYKTVTTSPIAALSRIEFDFDGQSFEFLTKAFASQRYRIWADGQPATVGANTPSLTAGAQYLTLVDFGSRANRRVRLDLSTAYFGGIRIGPQDTLRPPRPNKRPRCIVLGDSYTEGTGTTQFWLAWAATLGELLGWDVYGSGSGGTGYLNNAQTSGKTTFRGRVAADVIAYAPDIVIVCGGINDYVGFTAAQIGTEAQLLFAQILAALPNVVLIATGPWNNSGAVPTANFIQTRDAIRTALYAAKGHLFIDNIGGPIPYDSNNNHYANVGWVTGTGSVASPVGTGGTITSRGNADLNVSTDGLHPSQAGHDNLAMQAASAIGLWVDAGTPSPATVSPLGVVS